MHWPGINRADIDRLICRALTKPDVGLVVMRFGVNDVAPGDLVIASLDLLACFLHCQLPAGG